jgi:hypothetical protein
MAAADTVGQAPGAALAEFTNAITEFAGVVSSPAVAKAGEPACAVLVVSVFRVASDGEVKCSPKSPEDRPAALLTPQWPMPQSLRRNFKLPAYEE